MHPFLPVHAQNLAPTFTGYKMEFVERTPDGKNVVARTRTNVCGTPGCRCKATPPEKHGPYYQVSFTRKGKSSSKFVRKQDLPAIRKELKNYDAMKTLVDRWIDLATELSNLRLANKRS